jgi:hypothetical protein
VAATDKLIAPSSVARAIASGATAVERVDKLVQLIGREYGIAHPTIDRTVALIDAALARTKVSPPDLTAHSSHKFINGVANAGI